MHELVAVRENVPCVQLEHEVDMTFEKVPEGQDVQPVCPANENVPTSQALG